MADRANPASQPWGITRRQFLRWIGAAGGCAAVFGALDAWQLAGATREEQPPGLRGDADGARVLVLGAGPAGLAAAYELREAGYRVRVLEARDRPGGRAWTVRRGARSDEVDGEPQECVFADDPHQYFDAGAWRIPYSHRAVLYYCKRFDIALQPHKNVNLNAWAYLDDGGGAGRKLRLREVQSDLAGSMAELLAKAVGAGALDSELTSDDAERLIDYLLDQGLVSRSDLRYAGTSRRGYTNPPGAGLQPGSPSAPLPLTELLPFVTGSMRTAAGLLATPATFEQQETMLEPVGGMSAIYEQGFLPALDGSVTFGAEVLEIRQNADSVRVVHRDSASGAVTQSEADYCVCTIPLSVLRVIPADFSSEHQQAIESLPYSSAGKIGLQMRRRFWEEDDWIYGGSSASSDDRIGTIAYPDFGFLSGRGVLQGYYHFGASADDVGRLPPATRTEIALEGGSRIHPHYREAFGSAFSVAWQRTRYSLGGWASWEPDGRARHYPKLIEPDGRIYLAGEHLSYVNGWQEGAIASAWQQVARLHERATRDASTMHLPPRLRTRD